MTTEGIKQEKEKIVKEFPSFEPWPEPSPYTPRPYTEKLFRELYVPSGLSLLTGMDVDDFVAYCKDRGPGVIEALAYCGQMLYPVPSRIKVGNQTIEGYATMGFSHNLHIDPSSGKFYRLGKPSVGDDGRVVRERIDYDGPKCLKVNILRFDNMTGERVKFFTQNDVKTPIAYRPIKLEMGKDSILYNDMNLDQKVVDELVVKGYSETPVAPADLKPCFDKDGDIRKVTVMAKDGNEYENPVCRWEDALLFSRNPYTEQRPICMKLGTVSEFVESLVRAFSDMEPYRHFSQDMVFALGMGKSVPLRSGHGDDEVKSYRFDLLTGSIEDLDTLKARYKVNVSETKSLSQSLKESKDTQMTEQQSSVKPAHKR